MIAGIPVLGDIDRSAAITQAEPRRKVNGEAAMRPMRSGTRCACLPLLLAVRSLSGSGRPFPGRPLSVRFTRDCATQFLTSGVPRLPWNNFAADIRLRQRFNFCYCHHVPPETPNALTRFSSFAALATDHNILDSRQSCQSDLGELIFGSSYVRRARAQ